MTATADTGGRWRPNSLGLGLLGDERLARHAGAGDTQAFEIVYERYHAALYRYCRSILRNDADAQDALQSTFAAAFASLQTGQRDAPMRPWLFRIAHNESISVLRRRRPAFELSAASERGTASVEDEVAGRAEVSLLLRDLRELTDRQRSALVLRELSGLSHEEIAIALGTSVGGAKQMIFEARQSLFEFAEGRDMGCDEIRKTISDADGRSLRARRVRAHLRECTACAAFAAAIPARTGELHALAPVLPAGAAAGLLGRIALSSAGRPGAHGLARLAAGAAGKSATAAGFGANALAGVAVVASATVGVTVGVDKFVRAGNPAGAARQSTSAAAASAKAVRPSSSLLGGPFAIGARSGGRPSPSAARSGVVLAAGTPPVVLRIRSTGSLARGSGLGTAAVGGARLAPGTGPASAPGAVTDGASGAAAAGRGGNGKPASATTGGGSSQGSSGSSSAGSGRSGSQGSGRHGSRGSGHSTSGGSENSASGAHHPLAGLGSGVHATANAPGLAGGSVAAVGNAATHTASAVSNAVSNVTGAVSAAATTASPTIQVPAIQVPTIPVPGTAPSSSDPVVLPEVSLPLP